MSCIHAFIVGPFVWDTILATSRSFVPARYAWALGIPTFSIVLPVLLDGRSTRVSAAAPSAASLEDDDYREFSIEPGAQSSSRSGSTQCVDRSMTARAARLRGFVGSCPASDTVSSTVPSRYSRH